MNADRTIDERQDSSRVKVSVPDTARFPAPNQDGPHKDISEKIIGAAFPVSNTLGCGFLEKVYENALCIELEQMGLRVSRQVPMRVQYRNQTVGDFAADLIVENAVLMELKATLDHNAIYEAQTINYLRVSGLEVGLLLNFGRPKVSIRRFIKSKETTTDIDGKTVTAWKQTRS